MRKEQAIWNHGTNAMVKYFKSEVDRLRTIRTQAKNLLRNAVDEAERDAALSEINKADLEIKLWTEAYKNITRRLELLD